LQSPAYFAARAEPVISEHRFTGLLSQGVIPLYLECNIMEDSMKPRNLLLLPSMILIAAIATPFWLSAQQQEEHAKVHTRYKLIDLGTFGGPASYFSAAGLGARVLNNQGDVAGYADTSRPDPSAPNCFNLDCFLSHAFRWHDGVRTDLGAFPGDNSSAVSAINARGWIAGFSQYGPIDPLTGSAHSVAALWEDGHMINLGTLGGGMDSVAIDINDRGQIIGFAPNSIPDSFDPFGFPTQLRTFLWDNGVMKDIGTLGGPDAFPGTRINDRGQITGSSYINFVPNPSTGVPVADPFLWEDGNMIDLGSFGGTNGSGLTVNDRGQVVGQSNLPGDVETHAFLWDNGILTDLTTLGGTVSIPTWLSKSGEVVGGSTNHGDQAFLAFLWKDGVMTNLGTVDGDPCSEANSINARNQVVGISATCDFFAVQHAFLWENGRMTDLNTLIPSNSGLQLLFAADINDRGDIVGVGVPHGVPPNSDLFGHLFILIPCEESDEDCREDNNAAPAQASPAPATQGRTTPTEGNLLRGKMPARNNSWMANRHRRFGILPSN
jgi:probable HAF family extracellular repeat protein